MPHEYIEEIAIADVAFTSWGPSLEETFVSAAEALVNIMVADLDSMEPRTRRPLCLQARTREAMLFDFLRERICYKDAERLLLRVERVEISTEGDILWLSAKASGEAVAPGRHELVADVKAVTHHRFRLERTCHGWKAWVVVDI